MSIIYLASPSYFEMMIENTPLKWRGRLASMRSFGFGLFGMVGLWLAACLMEARPSPGNFHVCFIVGGALELLSCFSLLFVRDTVQHSAHITHTIGASVAVGRKLINDFNFRVFLVFYAFYVIAQCFAPLFIGYGKDIIGMSSAGMTRFTIAYYGGILLIGFTIPLLADRSGFKLIAHIGCLLLGGAYLLPLLMPHSSIALLAAYVLLIGSINLGSIILVNLGAELVPSVKPATIIAVSSTLFMPILLLAGPLSGKLTDIYGAGGYLAVFVSGLSLAFCALLGFLFLVREPRTGQEIYVRLRGI
jgi:MFS family permease